MKLYTGIVDWDTLRRALENIEEGIEDMVKNIRVSGKKHRKNPKNNRKKRK